VNHATLTKYKTPEIHRDASLLQHVTPETLFLELETLQTAIDAEHALFHSSQDKIDLNVTDQDQNVHAFRNTH
jgi:hypothetical protein